MSIITRMNKAEKRIVDLYNKLKNLPSGGGGTPTPVDPRPYKVYTALLTQSGTDAPVATVLENTLGGEVVWGRGAIGIYTAISDVDLISGKTSFIYNQLGAYGVSVTGITLNSFTLYTTGQSDGQSVEDIPISIGELMIEIRVYN